MRERKGFILYFDVLGYKDILKNNNKEENERISNILTEFAEYYSKAYYSLSYGSEFDKNRLFARSFSDNFLFVYELERNDWAGLRLFELTATRIQYSFLSVGLLTRGSITYGSIFENNDIVFGVDLIKAVELEEGHRMPSVVVDKLLKEVFDGSPFDYKEEIDLFDVWPDSKLDYEDCLEGIQKCLHQLNKIYVDKNVLQKVEWVVDRLNDYFGEAQKTKYKIICDFGCRLEKES